MVSISCITVKSLQTDGSNYIVNIFKEQHMLI